MLLLRRASILNKATDIVYMLPVVVQYIREFRFHFHIFISISFCVLLPSFFHYFHVSFSLNYTPPPRLYSNDFVHVVVKVREFIRDSLSQQVSSNVSLEPYYRLIYSVLLVFFHGHILHYSLKVIRICYLSYFSLLILKILLIPLCHPY